MYVFDKLMAKIISPDCESFQFCHEPEKKLDFRKNFEKVFFVCYSLQVRNLNL